MTLQDVMVMMPMDDEDDKDGDLHSSNTDFLPDITRLNILCELNLM